MTDQKTIKCDSCKKEFQGVNIERNTGTKNSTYLRIKSEFMFHGSTFRTDNIRIVDYCKPCWKLIEKELKSVKNGRLIVGD